MPWPKCSTLSGRQKNIIPPNGRQVRPPETGVIRIQLLPEYLVHSIIYIRPALVVEHLLRHPEVKGSAAATGLERK